MHIRGTTRLLGVMGWPVTHSMSPPMHNAALAAAGLDMVYVALPVPPERLADALRALSALGFRGVNVTIPHKEAVLPHLARLGPSVEGIGAVNTIVVEADGSLTGHNTDAGGFVQSVREQGGADPAGCTYFQAGAGGAGRAMAVAMARAGARRIIIGNRTLDKAETLAQLVREAASHLSGPPPEVLACGLDDAAAALAREADIVANATALGMKPGEASALPAAAFRAGQLAYDTIYVSEATPFIQAARQGGARACNGLGMLACQGALAFELWTGNRPDSALMLETLRQLVNPT